MNKVTSHQKSRTHDGDLTRQPRPTCTRRTSSCTNKRHGRGLQCISLKTNHPDHLSLRFSRCCITTKYWSPGPLRRLNGHNHNQQIRWVHHWMLHAYDDNQIFNWEANTDWFPLIQGYGNWGVVDGTMLDCSGSAIDFRVGVRFLSRFDGNNGEASTCELCRGEWDWTRWQCRNGDYRRTCRELSVAL
jgi:hypothetical protein